MMTPTQTDWKSEYSSRYLAYPDTNGSINGYPLVGYIDLNMYQTKPAFLPDAASTVPMTADQWAAKLIENQVIKDGSISTEIFIPPPVPLKNKAESEYTGWIQAQINEAVAMGETFTDAMKAYVKAVRAIASGADTTSTALPERPTTVFS